MRITNEDRRRLNRHLKDRIPAFLRAGLRKKARPMALIVSASILISSPQAYAKVQEGKAEPVLVMEKKAHPHKYVVSYDREELQKEAPANPTKGLASRIMEEVNGLLDRMWQNQAGGNERKELNKLMTEDPTLDSYSLHLAAMREAPKTKYSDGNKITKQLGRNLQKAVSDKTKSHLGVFDHISSGLSFDFDLSEESKSASSPEKRKGKRGKIRYGLVLKDINITKNGPDKASIGDDLSELEYAGHADVEWTIGPLEDQEGRKIFNIQPPKETTGTDSLWSRLRIPKASFSGSAAPNNLGNLGDIKDDENLPGWKLEFKQNEDYYVMTQVIDKDGKNTSQEHTFKVPIVGTMEVGRRFDDKFQVIETSAYNILIDKRMPLVSVHYMNMEQRYVSRLNTNIDGHDIELAASSQGTGTAPDSVGNKDKKAKYMSERYSLGYTKKF